MVVVGSTRNWPESHNWSTMLCNLGCDICVRGWWHCLHQLSKDIQRCGQLPARANLAGHAEKRPSVSLSGRLGSWVSTADWRIASVSSEVVSRFTRRIPSLFSDTLRHLVPASFAGDISSFIFSDAELNSLFSRYSYATPDLWLYVPPWLDVYVRSRLFRVFKPKCEVRTLTCSAMIYHTRDSLSCLPPRALRLSVTVDA